VRLIWVKRIEGLENIPSDGPIILAANHSSYFDFISTIAVCPRRITYLTAEVFYKSAFWRPLVVLTGQIKVERKEGDKSYIYAAARTVLSKGEIFGIYPEGTRSRDGKLHRAYSGVAKIAQENNVKILPVAISGAYEVMRPNDKLPRWKKSIVVTFLEPLDIAKRDSPDEFVHEKLMPAIANKLGVEYAAE
jgi:1-acyl-sn-glycerol-3-phosphate acyltransferase